MIFKLPEKQGERPLQNELDTRLEVKAKRLEGIGYMERRGGGVIKAESH